MASVFITVSVIFLDFIYFVWRKMKGDLEEEPEKELL